MNLCAPLPKMALFLGKLSRSNTCLAYSKSICHVYRYFSIKFIKYSISSASTIKFLPTCSFVFWWLKTVLVYGIGNKIAQNQLSSIRGKSWFLVIGLKYPRSRGIQSIFFFQKVYVYSYDLYIQSRDAILKVEYSPSKN